MGIYRQPVITVTVDGTPLTNVVSASVNLGMSSQIATAEIGVQALPANLSSWAAVVITLGATAATAAVRFTGYFREARQELYPSRVVLSCSGKLILATLYESTIVPDYDLSNHNYGGYTDEYMVSFLLYYAGLGDGIFTPAEEYGEVNPAAMTNIGGTGKLLGNVGEDRVFDWHPGVTSMAYIDKLDSICLGYRTYDTFDGTIRRSNLVMIPNITSVATFTEHVDIEKANETTMYMDISNRIVVTGFPGMNSETPISYTAETTSPFLQTPVSSWYATSSMGSPMIEKQNAADAGTGLSCEEVANWLLEEKNRGREMVTLTTPRDDLIAPGDTIIVNAPTRLGISSRRFWVESVRCGINESGAFSQSFTCISGIPVTLQLADGGYLLTEAGDYMESE